MDELLGKSLWNGYLGPNFMKSKRATVLKQLKNQKGRESRQEVKNYPYQIMEIDLRLDQYMSVMEVLDTVKKFIQANIILHKLRELNIKFYQPNNDIKITTES